MTDARPSKKLLGRALSFAGASLLVVAGFLAITSAWDLWGTGIQESQAQDALREQLDEFEEQQAVLDGLVDVDADSSDGATGSQIIGDVDTPTADFVAGSYDADLLAAAFSSDGALARIEIHSIGVDKMVVRGVGDEELRAGPGHYPNTARPGNAGNASIAGHRTTYGAPFGEIDQLVPGDIITVTTEQGFFVYEVMEPDAAFADHADEAKEWGEGHVIVRPSATWVLNDFGDDRLTLTSCNPLYSSRERIVVAAQLVTEAAETLFSVGPIGALAELATEDFDQ